MRLPEHYSFDFFLSDTDYHNEPEIAPFYIEKGDELFVGRELYFKDVKITYYIYPTGEHSGILLLYLGDDIFDSIRDAIDDDTIDPVRKAWPIFIDALYNGVHDNDSRYALAKVNFGSEIIFWTMYSRIENIDFSDLDTEYIIGKVIQLYGYTVDMLNEMNGNKPSTWKVMSNSFQSGVKKGIKWTKILSTAVGIGGLFFGVDTSSFLGDD